MIERGAFFEGMGAQSSEVAKALDIGAETVRSHLKKAQTKLGARNRTQAVAEALRQNLSPEDCRWPSRGVARFTPFPSRQTWS